uniref:Uncharacterized protein n=1 Tax=Heterorhabditis bacteriophora TaxID=37862 RepID=A0A1I7WSI2_HETBA
MCLWQIVKGGDLSKNILSNLHSLRSSEAQVAYQHRLRHARQEAGGVACLVTTMMMLALVCVIVVDCLFLHVVYRTFHFFAYKEDKAKEKEGRSMAQNGTI